MGELIAILFRVMILLIAAIMVRSLFRSVVQGFRSAAAPPPSEPQHPQVIEAGDLKKDPVCGTYVSPAASVRRILKGETYYFCSQDCCDRYQMR
jgi:uncharacterized protein